MLWRYCSALTTRYLRPGHVSFCVITQAWASSSEIKADSLIGLPAQINWTRYMIIPFRLKFAQNPADSNTCAHCQIRPEGYKELFQHCVVSFCLCVPWFFLCQMDSSRASKNTKKIHTPKQYRERARAVIGSQTIRQQVILWLYLLSGFVLWFLRGQEKSADTDSVWDGLGVRNLTL